MNNQIQNLQGLLKEKINKLDEEVRKRCENEEQYRNISGIENESQRKIQVLEEKLRNQAVLYDQEIKKLSQELERSRNEHEKLVLKLQENFTSAEILTDFITKSEQEKKNMESHHRSEITSIMKKDKEKDNLLDQLKKKNAELLEKIRTIEKQSADIITAVKENEENKGKIIELQNGKAQQRAKIKELESKIREYEELKENNEQRYLAKLEEIRSEIHTSYEEFEKTVSRYEGQLEGLKEQFALELRRLKGAKKSAETMDNIFQISKRDGLIKALRKELKLKSAKNDKKIKETGSQEENIVLQNQVFKLKAIIKNLEHQLSIVKEEAQKLRAEIDITLQMNEDIK